MIQRLPLTLAQCFQTNDLDIAGLADLPGEEEALQRGLGNVFTWVDNKKKLGHDNDFAELMFVLIKVAQEDYARDGKPKYWPYLSQRLADAHWHATPWHDWKLSEEQNHYLSENFSEGLRHFGYSDPPQHKSWVYLTPILFHAGVPRSSLPGLVRFIASYRTTFGDGLADLDPTRICQLVEAEGEMAGLHFNVRTLLASEMRGVSQLWAALANVIRARQQEDDFEDDLRQLPPSLDAEVVRATVEELFREGRAPPERREVVLPPRLRYDPVAGSVFLWLPEGPPEKWEISYPPRFQGGAGRHVWQPAPPGLSAHFLGPVPAEMTVRHRRGEEVRSYFFTTRPHIRDKAAYWPGLWFRAASGTLEQGRTIDASGLEAGSWLVLFEGTPDGLDPATRRPLDWSLFRGGEGWTAWEVEVPSRDGREEICWCVGDNQLSLPLARRSGPRLQVADAAALEAGTTAGQQLPVFSSPPYVRLAQGESREAILVRRTTQRAPSAQPLELGPTLLRLPAEEPGLYQLRLRRGASRVLFDFAVLPGLTADEPRYEGAGQRVEITLQMAAGSGELIPQDPAQVRATPREGAVTWHLSSSTREPFLDAGWRWTEPMAADLTFRWPVKGLRWRLPDGDDRPEQWTREPLELRRQDLDASNAQVEIHLPGEGETAVNGLPRETKPCPCGRVLVVDLYPFRQAERVQLSYEGQEHDVVVLTQRPLLEQLEVEGQGLNVLVAWKGEVRPGSVLLTWDPLSPADPPQAQALSNEHLQAARWTGPWSTLPGSEVVSMTLAWPQPVGSSRVSSFQIAVDRATLTNPVCCLVWRQTAGVLAPTDPAQAWPSLAHDVQTALLLRRPVDGEAVRQRLEGLDLLSVVPAAVLRSFAAALVERYPGRAEPVREAMLDYLGQHTDRISVQLATGESFDELLCRWLMEGIHLGWSRTQRGKLLELGATPSAVYPLGYFNDLWRLATRPAEAARYYEYLGRALPADYPLQQQAAAERVIQWHEAVGLPWPGLVLPWRRGEADLTLAPEQAPTHLYWEQVLGAEEHTSEQLLAELGLKYDLAINASTQKPVQGSRSSPPVHRRELRPRPWNGPRRLPQRYEATWVARRGQWAVEQVPQRARTWWVSPDGLQAPRWDALELADFLGIGPLLIRWEQEAGAEQATSAPAAALDAFLRADAVTGRLHAAILDPPPALHIPLLAAHLWRLAWIDRLALWRGPEQVFAVPDSHGTRLLYLGQLAEALRRWPPLARRCLALADLLCHTLYGKGLGQAGSFV
jgi:hypothetical protein